jgi:site-specific recombinase XerD
MGTQDHTNTGAGSQNALTPWRAREMYLESRRTEVSERTLELYGGHLEAFAEWCDENGVEDVADVTSRTLHEYRVDLAGGVAQTTLSIRFSVLRQLVRFCEGIGAIEEGTAERIVLPDRDRGARDEMLEADEADAILSYLRRYH